MRSGSQERNRSLSPRRSRDYRRSPPRYERSPLRDRGYDNGRDRESRDRRDRDFDRRGRDYGRDRDYRDYRDGDRDRRFNGERERFRPRHRDGRDNPKPSNTLGIFGMSMNTTERDLREIFERYGRVENVKIIMDHASARSRGFGFITFEERSAATKARERVADQVIDGMRVRVDFAIERRRSPPIRDRSPIRHARYSRSPLR